MFVKYMLYCDYIFMKRYCDIPEWNCFLETEKIALCTIY